MLLASNAAWIDMLRLAMNVSHCVAHRFAASALGDSLHYPEEGVRRHGGAIADHLAIGWPACCG
jgi:hypothetical protein